MTTTNPPLDLGAIGCEWLAEEPASKDPRDVISALVSEVERLRVERDLAVAHDRQPYPTAAAYEAACRALEKHRGIADEATAALVRGGVVDADEAGRLRGRFDAPIIGPAVEWLAEQLTAAQDELEALRAGQVRVAERNEAFTGLAQLRAQAAAALEAAGS